MSIVSSIQFGLKMGKINLDGKPKLKTNAASFGIQGPGKEGRRGAGVVSGGACCKRNNYLKVRSRCLSNYCEDGLKTNVSRKMVGVLDCSGCRNKIL